MPSYGSVELPVAASLTQTSNSYQHHGVSMAPTSALIRSTSTPRERATPRSGHQRLGSYGAQSQPQATTPRLLDPSQPPVFNAPTALVGSPVAPNFAAATAPSSRLGAQVVA